MKKKKGFIEARKFERLRFPYLVKYRFQEDAEVFKNRICNTRDISGGGISFRSENPIPVFSMFEAQINFPPAGRVLNTTVKVVRQRELPRQSCYEVGASFAGIAPADRKAIMDYIRNVKSRSGKPRSWIERIKESLLKKEGGKEI